MMVKRYYVIHRTQEHFNLFHQSVKHFAMDVFETYLREVEDPTGAYVQYDDYVALEQEVERLTARCVDWAGKYDSADRKYENAESDIAALVTALDEATTVDVEEYSSLTLEWKYFNQRDYSRLSPASRAVAEKWLNKEEK